MTRLTRLVAVGSVVAASLAMASVSSDPAGATPPAVTADGGSTSAMITADPGTVIELRPIDGTPEIHPGGTVSSNGELALTSVNPGLYEIWADDGSGPAFAGTVVVLTSGGTQDLLAQSEPRESELHRFGYIEVDADGDRALLSFDLRLPEALVAELPTPVGTCTTSCDAQAPSILEYSVYDASNPGPVELENDLDSAPQVERGYATLAVNVRGTGCSSGVFELPIDPQQAQDGYEVVEALAAQSWSNHRVGMVGTSAPGIEQLNVAATNPPHLMAITPAAVTGRPYDNAYPGGIPSRHFDWWSALVYLLNAPPTVNSTARKAAVDAALGYQWPILVGVGEHEPEQGRDEIENSWIYQRTQGGDRICESNAADHSANELPRTTIDGSATDDGPWGEINFREMLEKTDVPTLLIEGLNDDMAPRGFDPLLDPNEPAGGPAASLSAAAEPLDSLDHPNRILRVVSGSGGHDLSQSPEAMTERDAFLDLLVAERAVPVDVEAPGVRARPSTGEAICRPAYIEEGDDERDEQLDALYDAEPVQLYWEQSFQQDGGYPAPLPGGVRTGNDGDPCHGARYSSTASSWPLVGSNEPWDLSADGTMSTEDAPATDTVTFTATARNRSWESLGLPNISRPQGAKTAEFTSTPLTDTTSYAGPASVDLQLVSNRPVVDLEVTISEVDVDGNESLVHSGWRRTAVPLHDTGNTELQPRLDTSVNECSELTTPPTCLDPEDPIPVRIPIASFAHTFRKGSQIRLRVSGPGYALLSQPFLTEPVDGPAALTGATVGIEIDGTQPVRLVMPPTATPQPIGDDPGPDAPPACGTISTLACFPTVTATIQHPYDTNDEAVLHLDWAAWTGGPDIAGYHVYLDDEEEPVVTVDRPLYPGTFGVPPLSASVDLPISDEEAPTRVRVAPFVSLGSRTFERTEMWTDEVSVPSTDGVAGTQLLNELTATAEDSGLTEPRWFTFDPDVSMELAPSGHGSSDRAVELTVAPGADLPLAMLGADQSDMFEVTPGTPYHVEGWFKGTDAATRAALVILWWDRVGNVHLSVETIDLAAEQDWTLLQFNATPPPGATVAAAAVGLLDPEIDGSSVSRSVLVDDLAFCTGRVACEPVVP